MTQVKKALTVNTNAVAASQSIDLESEAALVNRAQKGDQEAYRILVEKYQQRVFSLVFSIVKSKEDAEDIVQEAFVKAYLSLKNFRQDSSFYTWIYRVAYNMTIDFKRKVGRRSEFLAIGDRDIGDISSDTDLEVMGRIPDPHHNMERQEIAGAIDKAMTKLSDDHRAVIMMREVDGLSYGEIAEAINVSKGTVMSRIHYAKKYLQKVLKEIAPDGRVDLDKDSSIN